MKQRIFSVNKLNFEETALAIFRFQYNGVEVYRMFCDGIGCIPDEVRTVSQIPFLPIEFFKSHKVIYKGMEPRVIFESSGTTGVIPSRHLVADTELYEQSFLEAFEQFYGPAGGYTILALLPSYLERSGSSLVYMADKLIKLSGKKESGFFLHDFDKLAEILNQLKNDKQPTILLGVTFGLLDFAEAYKIDFPELIVMETGGMKGRREEMTRAEVHGILKNAFGVSKIHSEYGMTELLSQAYSKGGDGFFQTPPWMKVFTRDVYDPLQFNSEESTGAVNIIDLANLYSCSFIATSDVARINKDDTFEILGRMDNAEIRGCNLMVL